MRSPLLKIPPLLVLLAALAAPSAAGAEEAPLPESDYAVRAACSEPPPGFASCLALQLVPLTPEAKRHTHPLGMVRRAGRARPHAPSPATGEFGLRPQDLHSVYSLPTSAPSAQTIAIVDAYNDPAAEADLQAYSEEFGLPLCTKANGCFNQVSQEAGAPLPFPATTAELEAMWESPDEEVKEEAEEVAGWGTEISLDIETAHATCQSCHILLVEANDPANENLLEAESRAEALGATVISNSWGTAEQFIEPASDQHAPFNDPGIVITASAGDDGFRNWAAPRAAERNVTQYPASSPNVVAVGGTRLATLGPSGTWRGETVWNGSGAGGGGCSVVFTAAAWQQQAADWSAIGCAGKRAVADVSADADPYTGFAVHDTDAPRGLCETEYEEEGIVKTIAGWCTYGGTSLASPIVASTFALAGGANGTPHPAETLYSNLRNAAGVFHDVTAGSNGKCATFNHKTGLTNCTPAEEAAASCSSTFACQAGVGYDGPTGVGTPNGVLGFVPSGPHETTPPTGQEAEPASSRATSRSLALAPPAPSPELSGLILTAPAVDALLYRHRPRMSRIAFSFLLTLPAHVRATLLRRVRSHGRTRWIAVGRAITLSAHGGRTVKRLPGRQRLRPGFYRLTVAIAGGKPQTIAFTVH